MIRVVEIVIEFKVDAQQVISKLSQKEAGLDAQMANFMNKVLIMGQGYVREEAPYKTGGLRRSVQKGMNGTEGFIYLSYALAPYFVYVINGTRSHVILPKNKKMLYWPGARHPVEKVKHPGTKANPFMDRAVPDIIKVVNQELTAVLKWLEA